MFNFKFDIDVVVRVVCIEFENEGFFKGWNVDFIDRVDLFKKGIIRFNIEVLEEYIFEYKEFEYDFI